MQTVYSRIVMANVVWLYALNVGYCGEGDLFEKALAAISAPDGKASPASEVDYMLPVNAEAMAASVVSTTIPTTADAALTSYCDASKKCCTTTCCKPCWRVGVFGEYLLLYPSGAGFVDSVRQDGVGAGAAPNGPVGALDPEASAGFRAGIGFSRNECSSIYFAYTFQESDDQIITTPTSGGGGNTVRSLALFPGSAAASLGTAQLDSSYDIEYQLVDIAFKTRLAGTRRDYLNMHVGARYGNYQEDFRQQGAYAVGTVGVVTEIDFDGGGVLLGLDSRVGLGGSGFGLYGDLFFSALFGEFQSDYTQTNLTSSTVEAQSTFEDERVLPILQGQLGIDWVSANRKCHFKVGHASSYWFNTITTSDYINATQQSNFLDVGDTVAFHGLAVSAEFRH